MVVLSDAPGGEEVVQPWNLGRPQGSLLNVQRSKLQIFGLRHFAEDDQMAVADDPDAERIQAGFLQLIFYLGRAERRQQAVVEIALENRRLAFGVFTDQGLGARAAGWAEKVGNENPRSFLRVAPHGLPEHLGIMEVVQEVVRQDDVIAFPGNWHSG